MVPRGTMKGQWGGSDSNCRSVETRVSFKVPLTVAPAVSATTSPGGPTSSMASTWTRSARTTCTSSRYNAGWRHVLHIDEGLHRAVLAVLVRRGVGVGQPQSGEALSAQPQAHGLEGKRAAHPRYRASRGGRSALRRPVEKHLGQDRVRDRHGPTARRAVPADQGKCGPSRQSHRHHAGHGQKREAPGCSTAAARERDPRAAPREHALALHLHHPVRRPVFPEFTIYLGIGPESRHAGRHRAAALPRPAAGPADAACSRITG